MKKTIILAILMSFVLTSCSPGILPQEYAKVSSDLAAAQEEIDTLKAELSTKENELKAIQTQLEETSKKVDQAKIRMEVMNAMFVPILEIGYAGGIISLYFNFHDLVFALGDPVLVVKFNNIFAETDQEKMIDKLFEFYAYLLESTSEILE